MLGPVDIETSLAITEIPFEIGNSLTAFSCNTQVNGRFSIKLLQQARPRD
jgi:hypothetical protein